MATDFAKHTNPSRRTSKGKKQTNNWDTRYLDALPTYLDLDLNLKYKKEPCLNKYGKIVVLVNQLRELCAKEGNAADLVAGDMQIDTQSQQS